MSYAKIYEKDEEDHLLDEFISTIPLDDYVDQLIILFKNIHLHWNDLRIFRTSYRNDKSN